MEIYILPKCVLFGLCKLSNFSPFVPKSAERFSALIEHFVSVAFASQLWLSVLAIGKPELQVRKASHCGSKQQWRSHAMITLLLLVRATYIWVLFFAHIPFVVNAHSTQRQLRGCNKRNVLQQ